MDWQRKPSWIERLIDAAVPPLVGAGAAAPAYLFAPVTPAAVAGAAFVAATLLAGIALAFMGRVRPAHGGFALETLAMPPFRAGDGQDERDELLLDDPLSAVGGDSRVVRLFAPDTLAVPGELAERIDRWLEGAREREPLKLAAGGGGHSASASPASAALHAALADIRRTLR